jgi:hypothetical protein
MRGEVARIVILVIASALLIATSPTRPPSGMVERSNVLPAGERRLQVHVTARIEGGPASVTRPFLVQVYVNSASMPEADGSPAAGAAVTASVRIDGDGRVFDSQEGIPAAAAVTTTAVARGTPSCSRWPNPMSVTLWSPGRCRSGARTS